MSSLAGAAGIAEALFALDAEAGSPRPCTSWKAANLFSLLHEAAIDIAMAISAAERRTGLRSWNLSCIMAVSFMLCLQHQTVTSITAYTSGSVR